MKKGFRIFLLFFIVFAVGGCSGTIEVSNNIYEEFIEVKNSEDVISNFNKAIKSLKGFSFDGKIVVKGEEHNFSGKVISRETIDKSVISINYDNNSLYLYDGKVNVNCDYKGYKIVLKDTLDNFVYEVERVLESKGIKYSRETINDIIKNKTILDVSFNKLIKWVINDNNKYSVKYDKGIVNLNDKYLPSTLNYQNEDVLIDVKFDYGVVSISGINNLDLFTLSIEDIKNILKVNDIGELIK